MPPKKVPKEEGPPKDTVLLSKPVLLNARATYRVRCENVAKIHCHRSVDGKEQFLIEWTVAADTRPNPAHPVYSWHDLPELNLCMVHVQRYINVTFPAIEDSLRRNHRALKRKADDVSVADSGVATPDSVHASAPASDDDEADLAVYNGYLEKRAGRLQAKQSLKDPKSLPTTSMLEVAIANPLTKTTHKAVFNAFAEKVAKIGNTRVENKVDHTAPSLDFEFISDFHFTGDTGRADEAFQFGCNLPCKPEMGGHCGCEYSQLCSCLDAAAVNEPALRNLWLLAPGVLPKNNIQRDKDIKARRYFDSVNRGVTPDIVGLAKRFPYGTKKLSNGTRVPTTLQKFYLQSRHPIYECNPKCNCGPGCKSRLVQFGRKVPLVVFKTKDRGWGVYCEVDLERGQFVDTYLGEVITSEEADRREDREDIAQKVSYLYQLDKWADELAELGQKPYVVDGEKMGSVTRFINHSCEPNLRQCTVSYNQSDIRVCELAFFALKDIRAGTELVFDYNDKEPVDPATAKKIREEAFNNPENDGLTRCNCGTESCRGLLWAKAVNETEKKADEAAERVRGLAALDGDDADSIEE